MKEEKSTKQMKRTKTINWNEVYQSIEVTRKRFEHGWAPTPEEKKKILKARAVALAEEPKEKGAGEYIEVIEFLLAYERYAVESNFVREVYPLRELTPLTNTPHFVLGIINVRGQILSVIDIKKFFGLPEKGLTDLNKVIILYDDTMEFGVLADLILGFRSIGLTEIQPSLPTLTGVREEYLKGVTKDQVVILDAGRLLSDKKIVVREEVEMIGVSRRDNL